MIANQWFLFLFRKSHYLNAQYAQFYPYLYFEWNHTKLAVMTLIYLCHKFYENKNKICKQWLWLCIHVPKPSLSHRTSTAQCTLTHVIFLWCCECKNSCIFNYMLCVVTCYHNDRCMFTWNSLVCMECAAAHSCTPFRTYAWYFIYINLILIPINSIRFVCLCVCVWNVRSYITEYILEMSQTYLTLTLHTFDVWRLGWWPSKHIHLLYNIWFFVY